MIAIIIVGYNSEQYLDDCLSSIFMSTYKKFRIYFLDNASIDNSTSLIKGKFPSVKVIKSKKNLGFAKGNNLAIKEALKHKADYLFILNPDTVLDKDCLKNLIKSSNEETILQPIVLLHKNGQKTQFVNTTGGVLNFLGFSYCSDYKEKRAHIKEKYIPIASGAAMLLPANLFNKVGFFDETFFMYHEDVDLSWRARLSGYQIKLIPESIVWHKYSFSKNKNKFFYSERNRILFLFKNFTVKYLGLIAIPFLLNEILIICYSLVNGLFIEKFKSYFSAAHLLRNNNKFKINKKNSNNLSKNLMSAKLDFSEVTDNFIFKAYNSFLKLIWFIIQKSI